MNITFISDTHNRHEGIDMPLDGDVICHCGDFSNLGFFRRIEEFMEWFSELNAPHKILIAGNHDLSVEENPERFKKYIPDNVTYLENTFVTIDGVKFWGSPITPAFGNGWAFNRQRGSDIRKVWEEIPRDTDVLLTHGPPYGVGDKAFRTFPGEDPHRGCEELIAKVTEVGPKVHAFGHIHEARTVYHDPEKDTAFVNCSIVNLYQDPVNNPVKVFINPDTKETRLIDK